MPTITHIHGNTYGFGFVDVNAGCHQYDNREFCQQVLNGVGGDQCAFQFHALLCGDDLVVCGNFATEECAEAEWCTGDCMSDPPFGTGWDWVTGQLNHVVGNTDAVYQAGILESGKRYKITITVKRVVSQFLEINGSIIVSCGSFDSDPITASGTYTFYLNSDSADLTITPTTDFDGAIDDISAYQMQLDYSVFLVSNVTGLVVGTPNSTTTGDGDIILYNRPFSAFEAPDGCYTICIANGCEAGSFDDLVTNGAFSVSAASWTVGTNWAYGSNKVCHSAGAAGDLSQTLSDSIAGLTYNYSVAVSSRTAGSVTLGWSNGFSGTTIEIISTNGTHSGTTVCPFDGAILVFSAGTTFDGCVDDVSVGLEPDDYPVDSCSFCIDLRSAHPCTTKLTWTNDDNAFGFDYESVPGFTQGIRVPCLLKFPKYPEDQQRFRNSIGQDEILIFNGDKKQELSVDQMPEYMHDALSIGKGHDHFYIGGVEYVADEGYEPESDEKLNLQIVPVKFLVRKKTFFERNAKQ